MGYVINNNLEQQTQSLYQQMFITNRNSNWKKGVLADLVTVRYGKNHKKLENGVYPVYGSGGIMRYVISSFSLSYISDYIFNIFKFFS